MSLSLGGETSSYYSAGSTQDRVGFIGKGRAVKGTSVRCTARRGVWERGSFVESVAT